MQQMWQKESGCTAKVPAVIFQTAQTLALVVDFPMVADANQLLLETLILNVVVLTNA